ncbi:hypothetical protein [Roseicitreum antarcticum]|uniref:Uncharacterized protein n=1 Tax=Roseicitreum antarcticum TaxID=564137 RepID=A0A1H2XE92_9RHOB|nr:hypothetical protein [Roseicitreum antarcticum]SDW90589.1 hypothetical protein SAMN04488238_104148 [Roseicitreum antarcticum]
MSGLDEKQRAMAESKAPDVRAQDLRRLEQQGYGVMAGVMGFGEAAENGRLGAVVKVAQLFVIAFAFMVPVYLFWSVAF